jgi:hypothetical protein
MANDGLSANQLINLGRNIVVLRNPSVWRGKQYREAINEFVELSEKCGFEGSKDAAAHLQSVQFYVDGNTDVILPGSKEPLEFNAGTIDRMLKKEGDRKRIRIFDSQPLPELADLQARIGRQLQEHQEALRGDTITCLQLKLARPAIILAWALGYDLIRSWVFNDKIQRLPAFNTQLASSPRRGEPATVNDFHNFFRIGEIRFLEICRDSQDASLQRFTDRTFRDLQALLDQRNEFAHANFSSANEHEANAYVARLIRIVTSPPFV